MHKTTSGLGRLLGALILILIFCTGCSSTPPSVSIPSQTSVPTSAPQIQPTITPVPPTPTLPPTAVPVLEPDDYLLDVAELPVEQFKSYLFVYQEADGSLTYSIKYFNPGVGSMDNSITVAAQAFTEVPDLSNYAGTPLEDPLIAQNARAYLGNSILTYVIYKGNALIKIMGVLQLEEAVKLAQLIESRLPETIEFTPIAFPDQLEQALASQSLNSLILGKPAPGSNATTPSDTFAMSDMYCLSIDLVDPEQPFSFAIYDVQEDVYVQKFVPEHTNYCSPFIGVSHPGAYELRFAINDTLVASLPFEIQ